MDTDIKVSEAEPATEDFNEVQTLDLGGSRPTVVKLQGEGELHIRGAGVEGEICIVVENGRVELQIRQADISVKSSPKVDIECESFSVDAKCDLQLRAQRKLDMSAQMVGITSTLGDLVLRANDFVRATGEKVLLNTEVDPEESDRKAKAFLARLLGR